MTDREWQGVEREEARSELERGQLVEGLFAEISSALRELAWRLETEVTREEVEAGCDELAALDTDLFTVRQLWEAKLWKLRHESRLPRSPTGNLLWPALVCARARQADASPATAAEARLREQERGVKEVCR